MALAQASGLLTLADEHLSVATDKGANPGRKVGSLVGGMVAGADSIADLAILRHGRWGPFSTDPMHRRRWDRSSENSPSGTSGNSTPSPPGS